MGQQLFRQKLELSSDYRGEDDYNEETFYDLVRLARLELSGYAEEALQTSTEGMYSELRMDIEDSQWFEATFPEATFALLLEIIQDPRFLKTREGWYFLMIFESEWEKITELQKVRLLEIFAEIYEKFEDWMPSFSISELVGENFDAFTTYSFFRKFATSTREVTRSFVPHGYEHALTNATDEEFRVRLWKDLTEMETDESEKVRGEVEESIHRLASRGLKRPDNL